MNPANVKASVIASHRQNNLFIMKEIASVAPLHRNDSLLLYFTWLIWQKNQGEV